VLPHITGINCIQHFIQNFPSVIKKSNADLQCGFRRKRSARSRIFYIFQKPENKLEYQEALHRLFIYSKEDRDSVTREVPCDTLVVFGVPVPLVTLIITCLNEI